MFTANKVEDAIRKASLVCFVAGKSLAADLVKTVELNAVAALRDAGELSVYDLRSASRQTL